MSHVSSSSDESTGSLFLSGAIYENVDYPLSFVPTGAGSASQWNLQSLGGPDSKVVLRSEAVRFPARFNFARMAGATGAPSPLQNGEIVTVTARGVEDLYAVALNWEEEFYPVPYDWEPTRFRSLVVAPYSSGASGGGETFIFSAILQEGRTIINLTPGIAIVPYGVAGSATYPEPEDGSLLVESTARLCLLANTPIIPDAFHSVVWPVVSGGIPNYPVGGGTPGYPRGSTPARPAANSIAQGSWVWKRS